MINSGKCPKCDKLLSYVNIEDIDVKVGLQIQWRGISYICPFCRSVLNIQIDPIAIKTDTVNEVVRDLKKNVLGR